MCSRSVFTHVFSKGCFMKKNWFLNWVKVILWLYLVSLILLWSLFVHLWAGSGLSLKFGCWSYSPKLSTSWHLALQKRRILFCSLFCQLLMQNTHQTTACCSCGHLLQMQSLYVLCIPNFHHLILWYYAGYQANNKNQHLYIGHIWALHHLHFFLLCL